MNVSFRFDEASEKTQVTSNIIMKRQSDSKREPDNGDDPLPKGRQDHPTTHPMEVQSGFDDEFDDVSLDFLLGDEYKGEDPPKSSASYHHPIASLTTTTSSLPQHHSNPRMNVSRSRRRTDTVPPPPSGFGPRRLPVEPGAVPIPGMATNQQPHDPSSATTAVVPLLDEEMASNPAVFYSTQSTSEVLVTAIRVDDPVEASAVRKSSNRRTVVYFAIAFLLVVLLISLAVVYVQAATQSGSSNNDSGDNTLPSEPNRSTDFEASSGPTSSPTPLSTPQQTKEAQTGTLTPPSSGQSAVPTDISASRSDSSAPSASPSTASPTPSPTSPPTTSPTSEPEWRWMGRQWKGDMRGDEAGGAVALSASGNTVAYGSHLANDGSLVDAGMVRVLEFDSATASWYPLGQDILGSEGGDQLGWALDLSADGRTLVVSSWTSGGYLEGKVQAYQFIQGYWEPMGQNLVGDEDALFLGGSVALSHDGKTLVVGSDMADANGLDAGRAEVYRYSESLELWEPVGQTIAGEAPNDRTGWGVDLSGDGNILAVAANRNNAPGGAGREELGHVRVFQLKDNQWVRMGKDMKGESSLDGFGQSLALSEDGLILAVGGIFNDNDSVTPDSGHVRVFRYNAEVDDWEQLGQDLLGEGQSDKLGSSVSLSHDGTILAIGSESGNFKILRYDDSIEEWIDIDNKVEDRDALQASVVTLSKSGDTIALGFPVAHNNAGAVNILRIQ